MQLLSKYSLSLFLSLAALVGKAQNIVPNPSFEDTVAIPCGFGSSNPPLSYYMNHWSVPLFGVGSSDIYSSTSPIICFSSVASIDIDWTGAQAPRTGSNYVGLFTYNNFNYREYVEVELLANMVPGDQYEAEIYVSKAERMANSNNNVGMLFTDSIATQSGYSVMSNYTPQIKSTSVITDEVNWVRIIDTITATSPKKFLTIGNFDTDANTSIIYQATDSLHDNYGYYYVDDVSVRRITFEHTPRDTTICAGDSAKLYALFNGFSHWEYDSLPGIVVSTDSIIWVQPSSTASYSAIGTSDTSITTVHVIQLPYYDLGPDITICVNNTVVFNAGNNNYSIIWGDGSDNDIYSTSSPGYHWIFLLNTCATYEDSILISLLPEPSISIGPDTTICLGDTIMLQADTIYDNYYWTDDDTLATLSVYSEGVYTLVVAYECGFISDYKWVYMDSLPPLQLANDTTVCLGEEIFINNFTNSYLGYSWQDGSTDSTYLTDTSGIYWLEVTHRCGIDTDSIVITHFDALNIDLGMDTSVCDGDTLLFSIPSHNGSVMWSNGEINDTILVNTSDLYWVHIIENGCSYSDSIVIDTLSLPSLQIESDSAYCEGDSLLIVALVQGEDQLIWSTGDTIDSVFVGSPGLYFVAATNICGASYDNINVVEKPLPDFSLGADTSFCLGEYIFIFAPDSVDSIVWDNSTINFQRKVDQVGAYWVTANQLGCSYTDTIYVDTTLCEIILELPNVFTPNDDGENDIFQAVQLGGIDQLNIQIFNRWGQLLYVSNSKHFTWDGRNFANEKVPSASYFYVLEYTDVIGVEKKVSGNIGLFR